MTKIQLCKLEWLLSYQPNLFKICIIQIFALTYMNERRSAVKGMEEWNLQIVKVWPIKCIVILHKFFCYFIHFIIFQEYKVHVRCLNLLECHSKVLLQDHGVNIQKFKIVEDAQEVKSLKKNFSKFLNINNGL